MFFAFFVLIIMGIAWRLIFFVLTDGWAPERVWIDRLCQGSLQESGCVCREAAVLVGSGEAELGPWQANRFLVVGGEALEILTLHVAVVT